jgi:hypothetical protein
MENRKLVDQETHPALRQIAARPKVFARQGTIVASWREYRGRKLGPYYRLAYRKDGRQRSIYLGRSQSLIERVRAALAALRAPLRRLRSLAKMQESIRTSLRREKIRLDGMLREFGLYLKGFEVRGWRTADPASIFAKTLRPPAPPGFVANGGGLMKFAVPVPDG